jgi:hypothetical protein
MKILKNKSGLILTEALLAISMLALGSLVLASIIQNSVRATALSKNYLIAQNLATEGMEAIKSVRDTNWLLQPGDPDCWLEKDPDSDGDVCPDVMDIGSYIPMESGGKWYMKDGTGNLDLSYSADDEEYRLYVDNGRYSYSQGSGEPTIFYRGINVISVVDSAPADSVDDYAVFEVVVEWKEGQKVRSLKRELLLYNFI